MVKKIMNQYKSLPVPAKAAFWFFFCSVLQKGIHTITTPIFTRLLTTEEYGNFSVFNSWLSIISIVITMSLTNGMNTRGVIKYSESKEEFSSSLQGLCLTSVFAWTVVYVLFHNFWNRIFSLTTVQMLAMLVIVWASAVYGIWAGKERVQFKYRRLLLLSLCMSVIGPVVGILFVTHSEDKVTARILGMALVDFVGYAGLFVWQLKTGKKFFDAKYWKYAILYSLPLIPQGLSEIVLNSSDRIMISRMIGSSEAGIYSLAYSLSLMMVIVSNALTQTVSPWIYQRLKQNKLDDIPSVANFSLMLVAAANLILIAIAPEAIRLFAPQKYSEAIWVIPPISMSVVAMFLCNLFAKLEFYYDKTYFVMIASMAAAVVNIVLNFIFIGKFGYLAAGYTTLVCYLADAVGHFVFMRKLSRENLKGVYIYNNKALWGITFIFMVLGFLVMLTYPLAILRYALLLVAVVLCVIFHRKIFAAVKNILSVRKAY